jgi:hypothetical protein
MLWFCDEQVDVLRHYHIPIDAEIEASSDALERRFEGLPACVRREEWTPTVARERNEVALSGFLKSFQTRRHGVSLRPQSYSSQERTQVGSHYPTQAKVRLEWGTQH